MTSTTTTAGDDHAVARRLADSAGEVLLGLRAARTDLEGAELKDAGDRASQEHLAAALADVRPDDAVLSEEAKDVGDRASATRVWIIDPLDGTREFSERPREDWAVHVALWQDGDLVAGAVARPAMGATLATDAPPALPERPGGPGAPVRLAVSRSRPPAFVTALAERLGAELVPMGSAGVKAMSILDGAADAYVHAGGQYEWDSAAPVVVARAAGLHTSRIDGSPLTYNREDPLLPDLLICRPELADFLLDAIADTHATA
ncbi:3'(2'),5'-bisphosphate nucleotidase CysQ [Lapillicoccus jejuensis]|uniref:3'(2'),5-bisphosphonucleoside 3'(2')-phosphohydrolase n=1 Tax=Lapillicoccus jejuensis TaxID=402171 RepID=A0A542E1G1_9MICO|nr:3'(2'),5'-bisphosphate nucleotidase CysQ [Lapillicoccus jejuensis]TQJ09178.1 3'(2'),5'-bisphosphate nucleotidase [Lapillicoccus jejuensis]